MQCLKFYSQPVFVSTSGWSFTSLVLYEFDPPFTSHRPHRSMQIGLISYCGQTWAFVSKLQWEEINLNLKETRIRVVSFSHYSIRLLFVELGLIGAIKRWSKLFGLRLSQQTPFGEQEKRLRLKTFVLVFVRLSNHLNGVRARGRGESSRDKWNFITSHPYCIELVRPVLHGA